LERCVQVEISEAKRILVVTKFRYLGDNIVATPFLQRLHEALPQSQITLLAGPAIPTLLEGCPYLSEVLPFKSKGWGKLKRNRELLRQIREGRFDAAFLVNRSLHSAVIARMAGIPVRIGFDTEHRGRLLSHRVPYDWNKPDLDCALDLLRAVGIPAEATLPTLWVSEKERAATLARLKSLGVEPTDLLIGMQPGANDPEEREWGVEKFAELADRLTNEMSAKIALLGSKEERAVSEQVAAAMKRTPIILTGDTGMREALATISLCRLWVGNDGGLLHAAVSLGPATVGIFGPTKAARWGYNTPRHRTVVVMPEKTAKNPASIRRSLDAVTVEMVYSAAVDVLK
jgi:heptosyltransferase-2